MGMHSQADSGCEIVQIDKMNRNENLEPNLGWDCPVLWVARKKKSPTRAAIPPRGGLERLRK
jgi:hypothetical protein